MIKSALSSAGRSALSTSATVGAINYYYNGGVHGNVKRLGNKVRNKVLSIKK